MKSSLSLTLFLLSAALLPLALSQAFDAEEYVNITTTIYEQPTLTSFDLEILRDWIGWKNDYPRYDHYFDPISNKFHPERSNYRQGILMMNFLFYYIQATLFAFYVVFLVCRNKCRRCGGKDEFVQKQGTWNIFFTHVFIIGGAIIIVIGCILTAFGNAQFKRSVDKGIAKLRVETSDLDADFNSVNQNIFTSNSFLHPDYTAATGQSFTVTLRNSAALQVEVASIRGKLSPPLSQPDSGSNFANDMDRIEFGRNVWTWLHFLGALAIQIAIIVGFLLMKPRSWFIIACFCFTLSWQIFFLMSYNTSEYFILVDICERMYQIVFQYQIPVRGESLGLYLSCLSPSSNQQLVQDMYIVSQGRATALEYANRKAYSTGYSGDQMTTQAELATLLETSPFTTDDDLISWNNTLLRLDAALEAQNKMRICKHLVAFSVMSMKETCVPGFDAMPQAFTGICMWVIGCLLLVVGGIKKEIIQKKINIEVLAKATKDEQDYEDESSEPDSEQARVQDKLGEVPTLRGKEYIED